MSSLPTVSTPSRLTRFLATSAALVGASLTAVLVVAVGCGGATETGPRGAGPVAPVPWNQADVCRLLTDREVASFLGIVPDPLPSNLAGRPACEWKAEDRKVRLTIYQLPQLGPDLFESRNVPVRDVGGRPAYVTSSSRSECTLQIAGGPAFITFDVKTPMPKSEKGQVCDDAVDVSQGVLLRLGW